MATVAPETQNAGVGVGDTQKTAQYINELAHKLELLAAERDAKIAIARSIPDPEGMKPCCILSAAPSHPVRIDFRSLIQLPLGVECLRVTCSPATMPQYPS